MIVTFGFDVKEDQFVPTLEPSMYHEVWIDKDINLPHFISKEFFVAHYRKLTFMKRFGFDFTKLKSEEELYKILKLSGIDLYYSCQLLTTRKRTALYTSCKSQLKDYIKGKIQEPVWSPRQTRCLCDDFGKEYTAKYIAISKSINVISSFT